MPNDNLHTPIRLHPHGHPALHSICTEVPDIPSVVPVIKQMLEVCEKSKLAVGLSAPQIGIRERFFVFSGGKGTPFKAAINPVLISASGPWEPFLEGCMSLPGFQATILRQCEIHVTYTDLDGNRFDGALTGLEARVFQHEHDHLNGVNITDKCSKNDLRKGGRTIKAMAKLAKKIMNKEAGVVPMQ
jgi:peptide deformylase